MKTFQSKHGFTLTEMLIVVTIISVLITASIVGGIRALEHAQAQQLADTINKIKTGVGMYYLDTHRFPASVSIGNADDPAFNGLLTDPGVLGWNGPYIESNMFEHSWGGGIRYVNEDIDNNLSTEEVNSDNDNTVADFFIVLDDDAAGTNYSDDTGAISPRALQLLDKLLDDGDLTTGEIRGNGKNGTCNGSGNHRLTFLSACGELMIRVQVPK